MSDVRQSQMDLLVDFPQAPREELIVDFPRGLGPSTADSPRAPTDRGVSFSDRATVTLVENLSLEHKADLWFSGREMDSFKHRAALLLRTLASNGTTLARYAERHVDDTSAFMGLESHMTPSVTIQIRERRRAVVRAVRLEYQRQEEAGVFDPDATKLALEAIPGESFQRARVIAMLHASNDD